MAVGGAPTPHAVEICFTGCRRGSDWSEQSRAPFENNMIVVGAMTAEDNKNDDQHTQLPAKQGD